MILGIVGSGQEKFTPLTEEKARIEIYLLILKYRPDVVRSGRSPLGGVDWWAEEIADEFGITFDERAPLQLCWGGAYGYKARNLDIAKSDVVACVVPEVYPVTFKGKRYRKCYHCNDRNPPHIKSGGCWTAWRAKAREWRIVE